MKGSVSLDAILAIVIASLVLTWVQGYSKNALDNVNDFGASFTLKAAAISAGSRMNAFFAWVPGPNDFATVFGRLNLMNLSTDVGLAKSVADAYLNASITYAGNFYSSSYPVPTGVFRQADNGRVRK